MFRLRVGRIARAVVLGGGLAVVGATAGNAAPLSSAATIDRALAGANAGLVHQVGEGNQLRRERQLRRRDLRGGGGNHYRNARKHRRYGRRYGRRHGRRHRGGYYFGYYPFTLYDYEPYYYYHPRVYTPRYSGRCGYWSRRCAANWGYRNNNYYGCMRYHGCR